MTNIIKVIFAIVTFFIALILVKVFVWDIMDYIRTIMGGICGANCGTLGSIFLILQYILTVGLIIFPPIFILRGGNDLNKYVR